MESQSEVTWVISGMSGPRRFSLWSLKTSLFRGHFTTKVDTHPLLRSLFFPFPPLTATVDIGGSTNPPAVLEDRFLSNTAAHPPSPLPVITCTRNLLAQSADHQTFLPPSPLPPTFHTTLTLPYPLPNRSHDGLFEFRGRCKQATTRLICWRGDTRRHGTR